MSWIFFHVIIGTTPFCLALMQQKSSRWCHIGGKWKWLRLMERITCWRWLWLFKNNGWFRMDLVKRANFRMKNYQKVDFGPNHRCCQWSSHKISMDISKFMQCNMMLFSNPKSVQHLERSHKEEPNLPSPTGGRCRKQTRGRSRKQTLRHCMTQDKQPWEKHAC